MNLVGLSTPLPKLLLSSRWPVVAPAQMLERLEQAIDFSDCPCHQTTDMGQRRHHLRLPTDWLRLQERKAPAKLPEACPVLVQGLRLTMAH
mmetsp:Transcript_41971/g.76271  ORF Transcript_41971/g.76271 Transcript_41971/m.76271 type:complete len:91 (-) Transcript_41971:674-946(-)